MYIPVYAASVLYGGHVRLKLGSVHSFQRGGGQQHSAMARARTGPMSTVTCNSNGGHSARL